MIKIDWTKKCPKECLLDIQRNTDFLYYVGQTYEKMENKEYVGIIIQQIVDAIEYSCRDVLKLIEKSEENWHKQEVAMRKEIKELYNELLCKNK